MGTTINFNLLRAEDKLADLRRDLDAAHREGRTKNIDYLKEKVAEQEQVVKDMKAAGASI